MSHVFLSWQHTDLLEEDPGPAGDGVEGQAAETDGYEADTEQLANTSPSSSRWVDACVAQALSLFLSHANYTVWV